MQRASNNSKEEKLALCLLATDMGGSTRTNLCASSQEYVTHLRTRSLRIGLGLAISSVLVLLLSRSGDSILVLCAVHVRRSFSTKQIVVQSLSDPAQISKRFKLEVP